MKRAYLDYNATAPLRPEARAAMLAAMGVGNPSSVHGEGRAAHALVDAARDDIAALVGGADATVIFTSGGTEACNLALNLRTAPHGALERLIVSAIEHSGVREPALQSDLPVATLPVTADGVVDLISLDKLLEDPAPALVCVMLANNETGIIQPVAEIAARVRAHGSLLFCDGVQAAGKIPVDMVALGCDALSVSAHKLGGPSGIGALLTRSDVVVPPIILGGGQEKGRRAGTENITGIAGFAAAARVSDPEDMEALAVQRDGFETNLRAVASEVEIFGAQSPRLPNTSCFALAGLDAETQIMALDLAGLAVSAGAACSSGKVSRSHVLAAMDVAAPHTKAALRVSLGWQSTAADTDRFLGEWQKLVHASRARLAVA